MHNLSTFARGASAGAVLRSFVVPAPDVAADVIITPDAGRAWEVRSVFCSIVTDDTDIARVPQLVYGTEQPATWIIPMTDGINASTTTTFGWVTDWAVIGGPGGDTPLVASMPHAILLPGYTLTIVGIAADSDDQFGPAVVQVVEISTGEREHDRSIANNLRARADAIGDLLTGDY